MTYIGKMMGGPLDGLELPQPNDDDPLDWPEIVPLQHIETSKRCVYRLRVIDGVVQREPVIVGDFGYFYYDIQEKLV